MSAPTPLKVLIVEDSENDTLLVLRHLRQSGFAPTHARVETAEAMAEALDDQPWDLVIADYAMPHFSAPDALHLLQGTGKDIPFIIISGSIGEDIAVEAMKAGAYDYIMKGNLARLAPAIVRELREAGIRREHREAEAALQASEVRYRRLFEAARDGILILDSHSGAVVDVNPFLTELLGYARDEILGRTLWELGPFRDVAHSRTGFQRLVEKGYARYDDLPLQAKDGSRRDVEFVSNVYHVNGAQVIQCNIRDIRERKRAEKALREALEWQERIFEGSRDAVFITDEQSRFTAANAAAERLTGYSRDELMAMSIPDLHEELDLAAYRAFHHRIMAGEEILTEARIRKKDGTKVETEFSNSLIVIDGRRFMHTTARDISERRRAEESLRESEEHYHTLVAQSPDGIFHADLRGRFLSVNERMCVELGYSEAEILAMGIWDIVPARYKAQHQDRLARILRSELVDDAAEYEVRTKDGRTRLIEIRSAPYRKCGKVVGFHGIARDVTDRRRAEEELRRALHDLAKAKQVETIGLIAGGVAHEVRNPLFAITTIVTALERKLADQPEYGEYVMHIKEQNRLLNALMNDLLSLGRPIPQESFKEFHCRGLVAQALARLGREHPGASARCRLALPPEIIMGWGAPDKIEQVLFNLLNKAFEFSPPDEPLTVRIWRDGAHVCLAISDHGPGIPEEMMPKLFQPFASKRKGGTGLGLAIVHKIVTAHGGTAEAANNEPPPGATFTVRLPLAESAGGQGKDD
ncbi:MAG: PAS domain S-box protein [Acidobacteriota bacterium]